MTETDFSKVVEHIRANPTLVIITGMPGCGKTTMAMRLMKEINGRSDLGACLTTTNEISDFDAYNIYVLDDVMSMPKNAREVLDMGKSLIIVTSAFAYIPQCYRRVGDDLKHLCRISFRCYQRGIFDVSGLDMDNTGEIKDYHFSGEITENGVEQVKDIIDEWIRVKTDELDSRFSKTPEYRTVIDGIEYTVECCAKCPYCNDGMYEYEPSCRYPENPSKVLDSDILTSDKIASDCPLGVRK